MTRPRRSARWFATRPTWLRCGSGRRTVTRTWSWLARRARLVLRGRRGRRLLAVVAEWDGCTAEHGQARELGPAALRLGVLAASRRRATAAGVEKHGGPTLSRYRRPSKLRVSNPSTRRASTRSSHSRSGSTVATAGCSKASPSAPTYVWLQLHRADQGALLVKYGDTLGIDDITRPDVEALLGVSGRDWRDFADFKRCRHPCQIPAVALLIRRRGIGQATVLIARRRYLQSRLH
jgi:hypothetical protein